MYNDYQVIAKNIKYLREKRGYTQEQLAEAVGLSASHLSKVESGKRRIGMKAYLSILHILGAGEEDFISIATGKTMQNDFKQYQDIMKDCNEVEKRFLLDTLENLKLNMRMLMCDKCPVEA